MVIPLPGQAQTGRDLPVPLPGITHGIALFGLTKRSPPLRRLGLQILDFSHTPTSADSFNPDFHNGLSE